MSGERCAICAETDTRYIRDLCLKCYQHHWYKGTLETVAPRGGKRKKWSEKRTASALKPLGHRRVQADGYARVKTINGFEFEHRVVMERVLGRPLLPTENVHHKNAIKGDNRPENLELWTVHQPKGARVEDLIEYLVTNHRSAVLTALGGIT